jgi:putative FmdB family regulatory protein
MPIYIYRCKNCGVQFEKQQSFSEQPLAWCPECSKKTLYKVYQPVGIVFKGSGFYATDHRSPSGAGRTLNKEKSGESKSIESKSSEGKSGESEASERSSSKSSSETVKEKD